MSSQFAYIIEFKNIYGFKEFCDTFNYPMLCFYDFEDCIEAVFWIGFKGYGEPAEFYLKNKKQFGINDIWAIPVIDLGGDKKYSCKEDTRQNDN